MTGSRYAQANHDIAARLQALAAHHPELTVAVDIATADLGYGIVAGETTDDLDRLDDYAERLLNARRRYALDPRDSDALYAGHLLLKLRRVRLIITTQEPT